MDFAMEAPGVELSKAIVTLRKGKVRAQPLTNIARNVRQSSRRPRVRRHQRSTRTAVQCARSATPDLPVTDHILTPSTDARRPRCASPPDPRPTSFLQCALFFPAPNRVTTVTSTAKCPPSHRQPPDDDHTNTHLTMLIDRLFHLSFELRRSETCRALSAHRGRRAAVRQD